VPGHWNPRTGPRIAHVSVTNCCVKNCTCVGMLLHLTGGSPQVVWAPKTLFCQATGCTSYAFAADTVGEAVTETLMHQPVPVAAVH
jgi:hypothetical protein